MREMQALAAFVGIHFVASEYDNVAAALNARHVVGCLLSASSPLLDSLQAPSSWSTCPPPVSKSQFPP